MTAAVLDILHGHKIFMQGSSQYDPFISANAFNNHCKVSMKNMFGEWFAKKEKIY